jgi:hypothetical protein
MQVIRETTDWKHPNHVYILDGGRLLAYKNSLNKKFFQFSKPIHFDKNYRSFEHVTGHELEDLVLAVK